MPNQRSTTRPVWPLLAPVLAPGALVAWVVATEVTQNAVSGVVLIPMAFLLVAVLRQPVDEYLASRGSDRPEMPEGLVQFTPGYFEFHAARRGGRAWPYRWSCHLLLALLIVGFGALVIASATDLFIG